MIRIASSALLLFLALLLISCSAAEETTEPASFPNIAISLSLSDSVADLSHPLWIECHAENIGDASGYYPGLVCMAGIQLWVVTENGEEYSFSMPTPLVLYCPERQDNEFEPGASQELVAVFEGELWRDWERTIAFPGKYEIVARLPYRPLPGFGEYEIAQASEAFTWRASDPPNTWTQSPPAVGVE